MPQLISVGQIIDQSWERFHKHFSQYVKISAWFLVPCLVSIISLIFYPSGLTLLAEKGFTGTETISVIIWALNNFIITPVVGFWILLATLRFIYSQNESKNINLKTIARESWRLFFPAVFISTLILLILLGIWFGLAPGLLINWLGIKFGLNFLAVFGGVVTLISAVAVSVLAIRWTVTFAFATLALVVENIRGRQALKRSHELVTGRFFSVLFRLIIPNLVFVFVILILKFIISYILDLAISTAVGLNADLLFRFESIAYALLVCAGSIFLTPIVLTANYLLFDGLKKNHS